MRRRTAELGRCEIAMDNRREPLSLEAERRQHVFGTRWRMRWSVDEAKW